jgi:prepilin-type processing-associated H-X9-DG protein
LCLSDLKQLTISWLTYTQENNDKIVNAAAMGGKPCPPGKRCVDKSGNTVDSGAKAPTSTSDSRYNETPWVGQGWGNWCTGEQLSEDAIQWAMETGALWKYIKDPKIYRCPTGLKSESVTYTIMDNMNGWLDMWRNAPSTGPASVKNCLYKNGNQIKKATKKIVFMDEGRLSPDSFAVRYDGPWGWFDGPFARHGNGTTVSFADGHAAWWLWKDKQTVTLGKQKDINPCITSVAISGSCAAYTDFYKIWADCWGTKLPSGVSLPANCKLEEAE